MHALSRQMVIFTLAIVACLVAAAGVASAALPLSASHAKLYKLGHGITAYFMKAQPGVLHVYRPKSFASTSGLAGGHAGSMGVIPFRTRFTSAQWSAIKGAAASNSLAPRDFRAAFTKAYWSGSTSPAPLLHVTGVGDNFLTCGYFGGGGCQPPDMAIASSPNWTVQAVNTSVAVYDKNGNMVLGFPVPANIFFGIPTPPKCTPNGIPFTSDPRAFYDPNDQRFFLAIGNENGYIDPCPFSVNFYVAVSQTNNPTGLWNVYAFNEDPLGIGAIGDYTQLGFDAKAVYLGMNLFPVTSGGFATCPIGYCFAQTFFIDKHAMESGAAVTTPYNFFGETNSSGFPLDTVQTVQTVANLAQQPGATPMVSADNFFGPTGAGCFPTPCNTLYVFGVSNPLSGSPTISAKTVTAPGWTYPPNGDEPGCGGCVETIDSRITGTPVYSPWNGGTVSFALGTGVRIGSFTWPSGLWGELSITTSGGALTGVTLLQSGYIDGVGVTNSFPDTMLAPSGKLYVVDDVMTPSIYPGWVYMTRQPGDPLGTLRAPRVAQNGLDSYFPLFGKPGFGNLRWGDFEASSYDGFSDNAVFMASQYGNTNFDWATSFVKVK